MKLLKILAIFTCVSLSNTAFALCNPETESNLNKVVKRATKNALPAAGIFYQHDSCIIKIAKGQANLALKTEIHDTDRFVIGSITKMFVAVTSIKLAEAKHFNLDDSIRLWLPKSIYNRIPNSDNITIRHLLSHSSGIFDYVNDSPDFIKALLSNQNQKLSELDALEFVYDKPLFFKPGTVFKYSNTNYLLIGLIINQATGKHFTANIRELILEPLLLNDTFHLSQPNNYLKYVHGYWEDNKILNDSHELVKQFAFADGNMVSSMQDLSSFIQALFTNKNFMSDTLLDTFLSSPVTNSTYGLGIIMEKNENGISYGHSGAEPGYTALLQYDPKMNETVVLFMTGYGGVMNVFSNAYLSDITRTMTQADWTYTLAP